MTTNSRSSLTPKFTYLVTTPRVPSDVSSLWRNGGRAGEAEGRSAGGGGNGPARDGSGDKRRLSPICKCMDRKGEGGRSGMTQGFWLRSGEDVISGEEDDDSDWP